METTRDYEVEIACIDELWTLGFREYFIGTSGELEEDEYQYRQELDLKLSPEEAKHMGLEKRVPGGWTMSDTGALLLEFSAPDSVTDYINNLPEYTIQPRD